MRASNIFSSINLPGSIRHKNKKSFSLSGFTLIELLVVITMVSVMLSLLIGIINPFRQIQKARDAQIEQDTTQIAGAIDSYFNDNNHYPVSVPFGSLWKVGSVSYMQKVPQDPNCGTGSSCYAYFTDDTNLQWNVLFAKLDAKIPSAVACSLEQISDCLPTNYASLGYNFCFLSGKVDCSYIKNHSIIPSN
jgi:prepilin-type N-terminal cleavage/methylation domain-containing protein